MKEASKQLSNSFSTGGGGVHFEAHVQASFVALMLTGGYAPCLPCWPISKIKLQGKYAGYDTDDLIVFVEKADGSQKRKMLAQIKHSISITEGSKVFGEVIQEAWNDFNNTDVFTRNSDVIMLITGPLSTTDVNDVRTILEWARHSENAEEFVKKVELTHFSSQSKQNKLQAFRFHLNNANGSDPVTDDILFEFMKHFHLLGYDLDIKTGVTLSLLHSLIGQHSQDNVHALWARLVDEVQSANKNAGTISRDSIHEDLRDIFKQKVYEVIPEAFSSVQPEAEKTDWNEHAYASDITIASLLGGWKEDCEADLEIIRQLIAVDYSTWIARLREVLQLPDSPVSLKNGEWRVKERQALWKSLGARLFDNNLDIFKQCILTVLSERDPKFDLPTDERYAASIHGKVLSHSINLRKGMSDGLALLGSQPEVLTNCTHNKPEAIATLTIRELFDEADWVLWGSLNSLLPVLSESTPDEFINAVEAALQQSPSPFGELFSEEGDGITGANYITGLLWALESLAWDQTYLVRACVILANLASLDPGGSWANRPANSLTTILLPWRPQTTASIEKRKVVLQTLEKEVPSVAWKLVLSLLPNQHQISSGTHQPSWRKTIPDDWNKGATQKEYWEQVSFYAEFAVSMASFDIGKLSELVNHLDSLPAPSFENLLAHLSTEAITSKPEEERLGIWESLTKFTSKHKRYSDAKWALDADTISKIETVANGLAPKNPLNLYCRLFNGHNSNFYEEEGSWRERQQKLDERRCKAIKDILAYGGIDAVIHFAETVSSPSHVGDSFSVIADTEADAAMLPKFFDAENPQFKKFISGYVWGRQSRLGWEWVDELEIKDWSNSQVAHLLSDLPFTDEAWSRASTWLGDNEGEYWSRANVNPYQTNGDLGTAIDKLIEYKRPHAAIDCLDRLLHEKYPLNRVQVVNALLAAVSSEEPSYAMDAYRITEIIKALQDDPDTDPDDLFRVEWAFLPLLDRHSEASPKLLENRLASDPSFFCEVIRLIYRSKNEEEQENKQSEHEKAIATNAWTLLHEWQTPPSTQPDGTFSQEKFRLWLQQVEEKCGESGHLQAALTHVGQVLFYCPADPQGLWIDHTAADALNNINAEDMRRGYGTEVHNSRGAHWVDPTAKPERELANEYRKKAEEIENAGYQRFAATLRGLSESYERDAKRIIAEHIEESTDDDDNE